jgi:hypothetical protein
MATEYDRSPAMQAARGQTYGKRKKQMDAQRAVPMSRQPTEIVQRPVAPKVRPGGLGAFGRATERPSEPITAGAPVGPGPGPSGAGIPITLDPRRQAIEELRAIYELFPSDDLNDLLTAYTLDFED